MELVNNPISNEALELIGFNDGDESRKRESVDKITLKSAKIALHRFPLQGRTNEAGSIIQFVK